MAGRYAQLLIAMKRVEKYIFLIILLLIYSSCHHPKKPFRQRTDCIAILNFSNLHRQLYPFKNKDFDFSEISKSFNKNVLVDSGYNQNASGDSIKFYKFYDAKSRVIFSLNHYSKGCNEFDIAVFEIRSNILINNAPVHFLSTRKDFFDHIQMPNNDCDTILIEDQELSLRYYRFEFFIDTLKFIGLQYYLM